MPSKIRLIRCLATVAILALALGAGCDAGLIGEDDFTTELSPENRLALGERDIGKVLDLQPFQVATIEIPANISTGFVWNVDEIDPRLTVVGSEYVQDSTGLLGSAGRQIFYVVGNDPGKAGLRLTYARPMESHNYLRSARFDFQVQARYAGNFRFVPREEPQAPIDNPTVLRASLPTHFSWCEQGACPPIRDQGDCGGCWAFGTAGVFESALMRAGFSSSPNLSEQYLISCNNEGFGCNGGWWAHDYHVSKKVSGETEAGGVNESVFPYTASDSYCNPPHAKVAKLQSWAYVKDDSSVPTVDQLKTAIYNNGPLAVAVCVNTYFENYSGGVFTGPGCTGVNHAVILVGWDDGDGAWIMRNTWGTSWGENGYMRIKYGVSQIGYAASYVVYGGTTTGPTASFSANATGLTVAFSDTSMSGGSAITSWSWNFGDGGTSTSQNPTHTYAAAGSYNVTLTVGDSAGKTSSATQSITVSQPVAAYCASKSNNCNEEWIAKVQVDAFSNASTGQTYSDFTNKVINLAPGAHSVTLTPGFSGSAYKEYWAVWIDFNGDKDFADSGEQVFAANGTTAVSGSITVPAGAPQGQTRMRVAMKYNAAPTNCETFSYGEVEDYTVNITAASGEPSASFTYTASGLAVSFSDTSTHSGGTIVSWSWNFGDGGTSTSQNPSHTYAAAGSYTVTLTVADGAGKTSAASQTVTVASPAASYCAAQGNNVSDEWIAKVAIGSFANASGAAGYTDFTAKVIPVSPGGSYAVTFTPGFSGSAYKEYWGVWIDFNGDKDFTDSGEQVLSGSGTAAVSGTLTIPATASLGQTRLRIAMRYNVAPSSCGSFDYGEVEDYTLDIASGGGGPTASFSFAAQGLTVSFTDTSTAGGSAIASRSWSFGDGTNSSDQNPSHAYAQGGTYAVTLTVTDAAGLSSSATQNVTVAAPTAAYCAAQGNNSSYEWLSKVQIDSFTKSSGAAGYSDFTGTVIPLATGSHSIALTPSFSGTSYTEYFRVWIDLDGNGDFAGTGELVFSKSGKSAVSGTLTIPTTAILGPTRMRVAMKYNSAPSSCGSFSYGEVEDYTVQIAP